MVKLEWGEKHLCAKCGLKFYDMRKVPAICPGCETKVKTLNYTAGATKPKPMRNEVAKGDKEDPAVEVATNEDVVEEDIEVVEEDADMSGVIDTETITTHKDEN